MNSIASADTEPDVESSVALTTGEPAVHAAAEAPQPIERELGQRRAKRARSPRSERRARALPERVSDESPGDELPGGELPGEDLGGAPIATLDEGDQRHAAEAVATAVAPAAASDEREPRRARNGKPRRARRRLSDIQREPEPAAPGSEASDGPEPPRDGRPGDLSEGAGAPADFAPEPEPGAAEAEAELAPPADALPVADAVAGAAAAPPEEDPASLGPGAELDDDALVVQVAALLFASPDPLGLPRLVEALQRPPRERVCSALAALQERLTAAGLPFVVRELAGGWRLLTSPEQHETVARLFAGRKVEKISAAAMETLSIVSYRQPVTKAEIEAIRGVQAGPVLRSLVERGLVRVSGRADQPGSPLQYATTREFLDRFGLKSLRDLPRDAELARD